VKLATKPIQHCPPHIGHVATLLWEINNSIFGRYSSDVEENANKLHFKKLPTFEMLIVDRHCSGSAATNFRATNWSQK